MLEKAAGRELAAVVLIHPDSEVAFLPLCSPQPHPPRPVLPPVSCIPALCLPGKGAQLETGSFGAG